MADNTRWYGFRWKKSRTGQAKPQTSRYKVASGYAASANPGAVTVNLWPGDPVKFVNDGTVALAAAGDAIFGVVMGIPPYWDSANRVMTYGNSLPSGTTYTTEDRTSYVHVCPVQGNVWEICCDDAATATTRAAYEAFINENCDHVFVPSSSEKKANPLLDVSTHVATAAQWRILDLARTVNQNYDFTGNYVAFEVMAAEVQDAPFVIAGV